MWGLLSARRPWAGRAILPPKLKSKAADPKRVMRQLVPARCAWAWAAWLAIVPAYPGVVGAVTASGVSGSQTDAAPQFLQPGRIEDPEAGAVSMHPDDLRALRLRILPLLRTEAKRADSTV